MSDTTPDPGLTAFARILAKATPDRGSLDRDALLFAAGQAAGTRRGRLWPVATAALVLLSTGLAATLALRSPAVREVERVVYVPAPAPTPPAVSDSLPARAVASPAAPPLGPEWVDGLRLRERILRDGIAAMPAPAVWSAAAARPLPDDLPDPSALRLHARPYSTGDLFP